MQPLLEYGLVKLETKRKIAEIERMTAGQMRQQYAAVFGEPTRSPNTN
jgi:hypothetical protein